LQYFCALYQLISYAHILCTSHDDHILCTHIIEWNYEIETSSGQDRLKKDAARVDDVFYYEAQRMVIASGDPDDSNRPDFDNLDSCQNNAAFCCFAQDRQAGDNNGNCNTPYENNCIDKNPAGMSALVLFRRMNSSI